MLSIGVDKCRGVGKYRHYRHYRQCRQSHEEKIKYICKIQRSFKNYKFVTPLQNSTIEKFTFFYKSAKFLKYLPKTVDRELVFSLWKLLAFEKNFSGYYKVLQNLSGFESEKNIHFSIFWTEKDRIMTENCITTAKNTKIVVS